MDIVPLAYEDRKSMAAVNLFFVQILQTETPKMITVLNI